MISLQATLRAQPLWGLEIYRPGTLLAGDSRHFARQEGWSESALESLTVAAAGSAPLRVATELLDEIGAERARLLRLAVRRQGQHLTFALNVPDPARLEPEAVARLAVRLADRLAESR